MREAILALFLGQVMPTAVALVVSVATRVWLTVIELAAAGVVYLWIRLRWHETPTFDDEGSMESGLEGIG